MKYQVESLYYMHVHFPYSWPCTYFNRGFSFLWECLKTVVETFWGSITQSGSICNLRELVNRTQLDKGAKTFSITDEFVIHVLKANLLAAIYTMFNISSRDQSIRHEVSAQWLQQAASEVIECTLILREPTDYLHSFSHAFMHVAFLYYDLRQAIRFEEGEHIIRHWKYWLPYFLGSGRKNYSCEAANLLCNIQADFPKHIAHIMVHNRTVNITGTHGHGKPIDQMVEHYNL